MYRGGTKRGRVCHTKKQKARDAWLADCMANRPHECWEWPFGRYPTGYGHVYLGGGRSAQRGTTAHRWLYELLFGELPAGLHVDHLCRNRPCVNWRHMEPVTPRVNFLRGVGVGAINARKTHCPQGHEYTEENQIASVSQLNPRRKCKACHRMKARERAIIRRAS